MADPVLSIVVPVWDQLDLTRRCLESIRAHTHAPFQVIGIDNGSGPETAAYVASAFDVTIHNERNLGFAMAMNQGLERAAGRFVAFLNNDTEVPAGWDHTLVGILEADPGVGLVVPAVTAAGNAYSVRSEPGTSVEVIPPFSEIPSGVAYVMPTQVCRDLGGWGEEYEIASSEDLDLLFKVWANGLAVVFDDRVLIEHASAATARRLDNREELWRRNRRVFVAKWSRADGSGIPRLAGVPEADFAANLERAALAVSWMSRWFAAKEELADTLRAAEPVEPPPAAPPEPAGERRGIRATLHRWTSGA